jgi:hypothetical protein
MTAELTEGLRTSYDEITLKHGPLINYLGMPLDFIQSCESRLAMSGYLK